MQDHLMAFFRILTKQNRANKRFVKHREEIRISKICNLQRTYSRWLKDWNTTKSEGEPISSPSQNPNHRCRGRGETAEPIIGSFEWSAGRGGHDGVFLHHEQFPSRWRPAFHSLGRFGAQALALAGVFVRPNMNILVYRSDDRLPGENQRRNLGTGADDFAPALKDRRHRAWLIRVGAKLIKLAHLFFRQRRRIWRQLDDLILLRDDKFLRLRRPFAGLARLAADPLAVFEALIGPDMSHTIQPAHFGTKKPQQLGKLQPRR